MPGPGSLDAFAEKYQSLMGNSPPEESPEQVPAAPPSEEPSQQDTSATEQSAEETTGEEAGISSFEELAEHYGVDVDDLQELEIGLKVNGQEHRTKLKDALASFQIDTAAEERLKDAKQQIEEAKSRRKELETSFEERGQRLDGLMAMARQALAGNVEEELKGIEGLRTEDPQEYFSKRMEIEDRQKKLNAVESEYQRLINEHVTKARDELRRTIPEHIPEWRDSATMQNESRKLDDYMLGQGFTSQQINALIDPKAIALVRKAMLFDAGKKVAKKVSDNAKPKLKLAGATPPERRASTSRTKAFQKAKDDLKKTGSLNAFAQFYKQSRSQQ